MCGFAGVINSSWTLSANDLQEMACKVAFRGPDSTNAKVFNDYLEDADEGRTGVFFNRLAIIDLDKRSDQPFEKHECLLLFNGEIYNYKELKATLIALGTQFETSSDTEVLFYVLKVWGAEGVRKLNGMFSFFWMDKRAKTFMIARDRIGIKPLYYSHTGDSFVFSSELHSIIRLNGGKYELNEQAVNMYLWMQDVPTPYSIIKNVFKLPPGHFIQGTTDPGKPSPLYRPQCYWDAYEEAAKSTNDSDPINLEKILVGSLERQLNADVPLGLFLSSGVDSSLLAALVSKHFPGRTFSFFTVAFAENTPMDESTEASDFIRGFKNDNLNWHSLAIDPEYIGEHLDELYRYYDEPFADYSSLMTWVVSRKARERVTVTISGDGADELFWGYPRYKRWQQIGAMQPPVITTLMRRVVQGMPDSQLKYDSMYALEHDPVRRHFDMFLSKGLRFLIKDHISGKSIWAMHGTDVVKTLNGIPAILDLKTYLADAMLYKVDRSSMAASLEVRVPYLDNDVVQYALNLDFRHKSNKTFYNKAILKNLLLSLAPHFDVNRPKRGFTFPMEKWLKTHWHERVMASVTKSNLEDVGLRPAAFLKIITDFYSGKSRNFTDVWTVYSLLHWHQSFKKDFTRSIQKLMPVT